MAKNAARSCLNSQFDEFKELVRELEADEGQARWDERPKKVANPSDKDA